MQTIPALDPIRLGSFGRRWGKDTREGDPRSTSWIQLRRRWRVGGPAVPVRRSFTARADGACAGATIGSCADSPWVSARRALLVLGAGSAAAKLSPVEQKWVEPLLKVYNVEAGNLSVVEAELGAKNALVVGAKNDTLLTETLAGFVECSWRSSSRRTRHRRRFGSRRSLPT